MRCSKRAVPVRFTPVMPFRDALAQAIQLDAVRVANAANRLTRACEIRYARQNACRFQTARLAAVLVKIRTLKSASPVRVVTMATPAAPAP